MPPILESIQVWVVSLAGQSAERWQPILSPSEWEKAMRFRFVEDQIRSAVTRGVLRTLLSNYLDIPVHEIEFSQNEHGKPFIPACPIEFNASHSGDFSLLAFAHASPIGVDVEFMKGDRVVKDLARRILTAAEYSRFSSLNEAERKQTFFEIWALKESVLKAIGSGLSVAPESIEINFHPASPKLLAADTELISNVNDWTLHSLAIGHSQYTAAVTVKQTAPIIELKHFES